MTDPAATEAMNAVAAAVTGPGSPDSATVVAKPAVWTVWALALAGPVASVMIIAGMVVAAFIYWPDAILLEPGRREAAAVMEKIVVGTFTVIGILAAILGVVVFRLASGGLKRVEARAGPAGLTVETGD